MRLLRGRGCLCAAYVTISLSMVLSSARMVSAQCPPGGITLLPGYYCRLDRATGVATTAGVIQMPNGLKIEFEKGLSQGFAVDEKHDDQYAWFRQVKINGLGAKLALIKRGYESVWEPASPRNREPGNILLATFPLGRDQYHAINFQAEITSDEELVDALLMIMSYRRTKK